MSKSRFDVILEFLDNLPFRKARVKGLNKESTVYVIYPYGLTANAPKGSLCISWMASGQESDRIAIVDSPQTRPKDLLPGEVVISNHLTKTEVRLLDNGDINITSTAKMNVSTVDDVNILSAANVSVTASGNTTVSASGTITLNATNVEITGSLTNNGVNVGSTHIHSQGSDSDGDSEVDTGAPHS